jgi:hypothetical protein
MKTPMMGPPDIFTIVYYSFLLLALANAGRIALAIQNVKAIAVHHSFNLGWNLTCHPTASIGIQE